MGIKMGTPPTITAEPLGPPGLAGSLNTGGDPTGIDFNNTGTRMFVSNWSGGKIEQFDLSTAYDITTASSSATFFVNSQDSQPWEFTFNSAGTRILLTGNSDKVFQYNLTTPFDLSTASFSNNSLDVSGQINQSHGLTTNPSGTRMFIADRTSARVYRYDFNTGFDISTASFSSVSFDASQQDTSLEGIAFNSTGTKMFLDGSENDKVYQYDLTTAYDITTATFTGKSFLTVPTFSSRPLGFTFNNAGTRLFVVAESPNSVFQFNLGTPFDISTI